MHLTTFKVQNRAFQNIIEEYIIRSGLKTISVDIALKDIYRAELQF